MNGNERDTGNGSNGELGAAEHERLRQGLRALPDTAPRRDLWQRIEAQGRAEGLLRGESRLRRARWPLGAALAATVALAVLRFPPFGVSGDVDEPFPTEPAYTGTGPRHDLNALRVRSQVLEGNLRALPTAPRVVRAGTAATISALEDRIAAIDAVLNDPDDALSPREAELYWRERVRLMDSLLQVRYAQAQRLVF